MEKYKIIENRPELTPSQIKEGMDFNRIKTNATLAKSTFLKTVFIKGILGVVAISVAVIVYKKNNSNVSEKTAVVEHVQKELKIPENNNVIAYQEVSNDKNVTPVIVHKPTDKTTVIVSDVVKDCVMVPPVITSIPYRNEQGSFFKSDNYLPVDERENTTNSPVYTTTGGLVDIKTIDKSIAKVKEGLYASKYEVSNKLYATFLNILKKSSKQNLVSVAEIDSLKWKDKLSYNSPYVDYYHVHPAYQNYPVVNISYEGAKLFCEWLTEQYNVDPKRKFKKVAFRLPSEEEWIIAAQAGNSAAIYAWEDKDLDDKKKSIKCNFKRASTIGNEKDVYKGDVTTPVNAFSKNNFGIYNMCGNVAEMIDEKGIVKGGSWRDGPEYLKIEAYYKYDGKPQAFVGFRYFMEVIEK